MDYVFLIVSASLVLACFYFIISPFFAPKGELAGVGKERAEPLTLDAIYTAVNELEMDYLMKKMTDDDFNKLKEQYQLLAAEVMNKEKKQQAKKSNRKNDEEIELEILAELQKIRTKKGRS